MIPSEYKMPNNKTPNVTKRLKQNAQLQNAQCNKTFNETKGPITKRPMLQKKD